MKALKIIGIIVLILCLLGGITWLITKSVNDSANESVFKAIPEEADAIMVVNIEAFMSLIINNIGDVWDLAEGFKEEGKVEEFQKEAQLTGINLSRKVAIFAIDDEISVLLPVKSKSEFDAYLQKLSSKSNLTSLAENEYYSSDLGAYISFNESICYLTKVRRSDVNIAKEKWLSISSSKEERILDPIVAQLQDSDEHLAIYVKENEMAGRSPVFQNSPAQFSVLTFEDGKIRLKSKITSTKDEVTNPLITGGMGSTETDFLSFHAHFNTDADFDYWLSAEALQSWQKELEQAEASSKEFIEKWDGSLNFTITGSGKSLVETIVFDYDDNFNVIEKKELVEQNNLTFTGNLGFKAPFSDEQFLSDQLDDSSINFSAGENNSLWFSSAENYEKKSNPAEHALHLVAYPGALIDLGVDVDLPFVQMADRFKNLFRKIELTADPEGNEIVSELVIYTGDENKNSLIFLVGEIQKLR